MKTIWQIRDYDVVAYDEGFMVNDSWENGHVVFDDVDSQLIGWVRENYQVTGDISNDGDDQVIYINVDDVPLCELHKVELDIPKSLEHYWDAEKQELINYAWPGGYQVTYYTKQGGTLCPKCANEEIWDMDSFDRIIGADIYYEGPDIYCDGCNEIIESFYGDPFELNND